MDKKALIYSRMLQKEIGKTKRKEPRTLNGSYKIFEILMSLISKKSA